MRNIDMENAVNALEKHLGRSDILGYAAARNTRILQNELIEYEAKKNELILEYGDEDSDGVSLRFDSPRFAEFVRAIELFAVIEHEPNVFKVKPDDVIGVLTGTEILEIDWMIAEE